MDDAQGQGVFCSITSEHKSQVVRAGCCTSWREREKSFREILEKLKFSWDENESRETSIDVVGAYFQLMSSYREQSNMGKEISKGWFVSVMANRTFRGIFSLPMT